MARRATPAMERPARVRIRVTGNVQGVGFRPYAFRLAGSLGLGGYVRNDALGVLLEVEGSPGRVEEFIHRLPREAPPLSRVEDVTAHARSPSGEREFRILESEHRGEPHALVSADTATCPECLAELFDPGDRRFRYPYINCTNCGPRFTIIRGIPYDRPLTTMSSFAMCPRCRAEYEDPGNRRFHAQPNACPDCGPGVRLLDGDGRELSCAPRRDPIETAASVLRSGRIVAVKGVGGYHLACRADDQAAVTALRSRKRREDKPFALMAPDLDAARALVELTPHEAALLSSPERPILIARRRGDAVVADAVGPRSRELGVMLPYSPVHHLLLADAGVTLVMTSGNVSDEPIAHLDEEALRRLHGIADAFLVGARAIHVRTDDSVLRSLDPAVRHSPLLMRRSRGFVPGSIELPLEASPAVLGCGAELKSTFCVAKGRRAWVGHHIGDLRSYETLMAFRAGIEHFERIFSVVPEVIAHDLHPDYLSTAYALDRGGAELVGIQHHHAHFAACLGEARERGPAVGAIYDGSGWGEDGTVWGGEILAGDVAGSQRAGHLVPVRMPGGDAAVREPWRMACAWLAAAFESDSPRPPRALKDKIEPTRWDRVCRLVSTGTSSPRTTSVGRLFDAVAALCGICARVSYEGQAAAELEGAAAAEDTGAYPLPIMAASGSAAERTVLDARETIQAVVEDLERGAPVPQVAARFHAALAAATAEACEREAERLGVDLAVLSGGVFQNRLLLERTATLLAGRGMRVSFPRRLPPNDGGLSYGQVVAAAARLQA